MTAVGAPATIDWRHNVALAGKLSWRCGGAARRYYAPASLADLALAMASLPTDEVVLFLGLGSNLLVRDGGFNGSVIALHGGLSGLYQTADGRIYAEAGVGSPKLAAFATGLGFGEAAFLAGIPGTVGGALAMNAGCHGNETWRQLVRVQTIDRQGHCHWRRPDQFCIGYREVYHATSRSERPRQEWFVAGEWQFAEGDRDAARQASKAWLDERRQKQPLEWPSAGSVFRNPPNDHAARLIEAAGLKGRRLGGAQVSPKHANFIINADGEASAADIEALIALVAAEVAGQFGVHLQPEVHIVGDAVATPGS